jgi:hypothetical protein
MTQEKDKELEERIIYLERREILIWVCLFVNLIMWVIFLLK